MGRAGNAAAVGDGPNAACDIDAVVAADRGRGGIGDRATGTQIDAAVKGRRNSAIIRDRPGPGKPVDTIRGVRDRDASIDDDWVRIRR